MPTKVMGIAAWLICLVSSCGFDSAGASAGPAGPVDDDDISLDATGDDSAVETGSSDVGASSGAVSSDGNETTASEAPLLRISPGPSYDFGHIVVGDESFQTFIIENTGAFAALSVSADPPTSSFTFRGYDYPGIGGTCRDKLEPGEKCSVVIAFRPTIPKRHSSDFIVAYHGSQSDRFELQLGLVGRGFSRNLIENGDGEQGGTPPVGWLAGDEIGSWAATDCERAAPQSMPWTGDFCLGHASMGSGADNTTQTEIQQDIRFEGWDMAIARAEIRLELLGVVRSWTVGNDEWRLWAEFLDENLTPIDTFYDTDWESSADWVMLKGEAVPPMNARHVRIRLMCRINVQPGRFCDVFFDDLSLQAFPHE